MLESARKGITHYKEYKSVSEGITHYKEYKSVSEGITHYKEYKSVSEGITHNSNESAKYGNIHIWDYESGREELCLKRAAEIAILFVTCF